jgi:hypothetical protein
MTMSDELVIFGRIEMLHSSLGTVYLVKWSNKILCRAQSGAMVTFHLCNADIVVHHFGGITSWSCCHVDMLSCLYLHLASITFTHSFAFVHN